MVQKMNQSFQEGVDSKLELIVFSHQPILQKVGALKMKSGGIPASSLMILNLVIGVLSQKRLQRVQYFFINYKIA